MSEFWLQCQNQIINGLYPLNGLLSGCDHSAVFATECAAHGLRSAAVKVVTAERVTLAQLSYWRTVAALSHPHLIRLLDAGLWQFAGRQFLFVVMEYADQTLAQVLLRRALTEEEVQQMLPPVLDALAFLHGQNLVQGQLKPANILVVDDQLKLASDTVRPVGEPRMNIAQSSPYDPPEARSGRLFPAGDIWALGMTMVEALTQRIPATHDRESIVACLPATVAPALVETILQCLSPDSASRPPASAPQAVPPSILQTPTEVPARPLPPQQSHVPRSPAWSVATVLILIGTVWLGMYLARSHHDSRHLAASTPQTSPRPGAGGSAGASQAAATPVPARPEDATAAAPAKPANSDTALRSVARRPDPLPQTSPYDSASVVHEQMPIASRSALETVHGHVKVAVLVTVAPSGDVIDTLMQSPGPSAYFARLAGDAARKWKFAAADKQGTRKWLLRFEFTREGATGHAVAKQP